MNFKPLRNEKEYKNTKKWLKEFKKDNIELKIQFPDLTTNEAKLIAKPVYRLINILEAEIQDYEHRKKGNNNEQ